MCTSYLPTKEDIELEEWIQAYSHFNKRLNERYGMSIRFYEYKILCRNKVDIIKVQTKNKSLGYINIKGVSVLVVKERSRRKILSTALPLGAA